MKCLFIVGMIIVINSIYAMNEGNTLLTENCEKKITSELRLLNIQTIYVENNDDDFSDTSSSIVEADKFLPLPILSPDVDSVAIDFDKFDILFKDKQDAKNWKPPIIPFNGASEFSEVNNENNDHENSFNFLF